MGSRGKVALRRAHRCIVGLVGAISVCLVMTVPAAAAPVDTASDHVLIHAFGTYLTGVLTDVPNWRTADNAYISHISASCPNVLAAVNLLPSKQFNPAAAVAIGEEAGGDLLVIEGRLILHRLARLDKSTSPLHWSNRQASSAVQRYLRATKALYSLAPSDLCADATAFAASNAKTTPAGTLRWLATFGTLGADNQRASGAFGEVLAKYHSSRDTGTLKHVLKLLLRMESADANVVTHEGRKLLAALGLTS